MSARTFLLVVFVGLGGWGAQPAAAQPAAAQPTEANAPGASEAAGPQTLAFINGRVFDGARFVERPLYVKNGRFVAARPAGVDTTIDVGGDYVVPPYGDAHNHHTVDPWIYEKASQDFIDEGTFYSQTLTNRKTSAARTRDYFLDPATIDVSTAHGGITGTLGHPFLAYEPRAMGLPADQWRAQRDSIAASRLLEGDAYWFVDTRDDLAAMWPAFVADAPDVVKIYLLDAANPPPDSVRAMGRKGLRPGLVAPVVQRAHAAGLRVMAHVETAADVQLAADAGVDGIGHLPGYGMPSDADVDRYALPDTLIAQMARQDMMVVPTTLVSTQLRSDSTRYARIAALQRSMLGKLHAAGVRIAIGADWYGRPAYPEYANLAALDAIPRADLLDSWSRVTPQAIFPTRRIGRLAPGYEASLLILTDNPLGAVEHATSIRLRLKQGRLL